VVLRVRSFASEAGPNVINGGSCGHRASETRWVYFGLLANGKRPGARGLSLVLHPANGDGRAAMVDSVVQVAGLDLAPRGTAVQQDRLSRGTFSGTWHGTYVTGSWVCEDAALGGTRVHRVG